MTPSVGDCNTFEQGVVTQYPEDFTVLNSFTHYECPSSGLRIIRANGIPDHEVQQDNPMSACAINWQYEMPLTPTWVSEITEPGALGTIAVAANGVPIYGAQEGGGTNAVEPDGQIVDAQYWYGHAAQSGDWHYHASELGKQSVDSSTFLGWAMDGFEIYGPLDDDSVLDECNGMTVSGTYRYHVRTDEQVNSVDYCDGTSAAIKWNYVLGCYHGDLAQSQVTDSTTATLPSDCVEASDEASTASPSPSLPPAPPPSPFPAPPSVVTTASPSLPPAPPPSPSPYVVTTASPCKPPPLPTPPSLPLPATADSSPSSPSVDYPACEYEGDNDACPIGTRCTCYGRRARSLLFSSVPSLECSCVVD